MLYENDNAYADIPGPVPGDFTYEFERSMLQRVKDMPVYMGKPGRQLLYRSDWPLVRMGSYAKFLENLGFPAEQKQAIAWKTAARLFRIDTERIPKGAAAPETGA